jgi:hypothetical protein
VAIAIRHATAADGTFSAAGAAAWDAALAWSGLTAGQIPYPSSATALTDSANLTFDGTTLSGMKISAANGSTSAPSIAFAAASTWGFSWQSGIGVGFNAGSTNTLIAFGAILTMGANYPFGWSSSAAAGNSADSALSRVSAGVIGVGTGAAGNSAGTIQCKHNSSDGTAGVASFTGAVASITIKDGIVTAIS